LLIFLKKFLSSINKAIKESVKDGLAKYSIFDLTTMYHWIVIMLKSRDKWWSSLAAINGRHIVKRRITSRQGKHLLQMGPVHPGAQPAFDHLHS
jgi:hypothetical protein